MVNSLVFRGSGLNCNFETGQALRLAGSGKVVQAHISEVISKKYDLMDFHIVIVPGGFSYGDDLGAGKIMATQIRHTLREKMQSYIDDGRLLAGICNGFQVLIKTGFLPGNCNATLTNNDSGHFEDRWVHLRPNAGSGSLFTKGIKKLYLPVNHGEGKFVADEKTLDFLQENGQVVLGYCSGDLSDAKGYPENPNGSVRGIAGITNRKGNVFGMMPHPEKFIMKWQHPSWTRHPELNDEGDGLQLFRNMVTYAGEELQ